MLPCIPAMDDINLSCQPSKPPGSVKSHLPVVTCLSSISYPSPFSPSQSLPEGPHPFSALPQHTAASGMSESENLLSLAFWGPQNRLFCGTQHCLWCPRFWQVHGDPRLRFPHPWSKILWLLTVQHRPLPGAAAWGPRSQTPRIHLAQWP